MCGLFKRDTQVEDKIKIGKYLETAGIVLSA
jgi:hypothetical protein